MSILQIPPNRAKIAIKAPVSTADKFIADLKKLGLTADDLSPIDWRKKAPLVHVKNQGDCGDCWAQSSSSALSDRFIIQKGIQNLDIDATIVTQCAASNINQGCDGDNPYDAGMYFVSTGGVDSSVVSGCPAWKSICNGTSGCSNLPTCSQLTSECIRNDTKVYKATKNSVQSTTVTDGNSGSLNVDAQNTIINMKKHLLNGPFPVCFFVANDFYGPSVGYNWTKTNGVYINGMYNDDLDKIVSSSVKSSLGISNKNQWADIIMEDGSPAGHAVELVGWGIENAGKGRENTPCWYIKNSWGSDWNEEGYFRIAMNDFATTGQHYNSLLGLDVPVSSVIQSSTGQIISQEGSLFGGGTVFDPDLSTGDAPGTVLNTKSSSKKRVILWIVVGVVVILFLCFAYKMYRKK